MQEIEEKRKFLLENINYILGPYYIFNQKSKVISLDKEKIKKLPEELIKRIANYLVDNDQDNFEKYILDLQKDGDFLQKYQDKIYLSLAKQNNDNRCFFMILLLDSIKKYLHKNSANSDKIALLQKYFDFEKK